MISQDGRGKGGIWESNPMISLSVGHSSPYSLALYPLYGGVLHIIDVVLGLLVVFFDRSIGVDCIRAGI